MGQTCSLRLVPVSDVSVFCFWLFMSQQSVFHAHIHDIVNTRVPNHACVSVSCQNPAVTNICSFNNNPNTLTFPGMKRRRPLKGSLSSFIPESQSRSDVTFTKPLHLLKRCR